MRTMKNVLACGISGNVLLALVCFVAVFGTPTLSTDWDVKGIAFLFGIGFLLGGIMFWLCVALNRRDIVPTAATCAKMIALNLVVVVLITIFSFFALIIITGGR